MQQSKPLKSRNIKLTLEYDGTEYSGWQRQSHSQKTKSQGLEIKTIQETIEEALEKIVQEKIKLIGSGRTDAGVHALGYVANFKTLNPLPIISLQRGLNSLLPNDIIIKEAEEARADFNSRYSSKSKTYRYIILNSPLPSPFLERYTYFYPYPLNITLLKKEAKYLLGKHNFSSFCASGSGAKGTIRTIKKISLKKFCYTLYATPCTLIFIDIKANGFLYKMARNIVGTLIDINRGKIKGMREVLRAKDRKKGGTTAPPQGLCLLKISYR